LDKKINFIRYFLQFNGSKNNSSNLIKPLYLGYLLRKKERILEAEVKDLLERGLIEEGDGSWRARVVLVRKERWEMEKVYRLLTKDIQDLTCYVE
jgi:hypothetical protein